MLIFARRAKFVEGGFVNVNVKDVAIEKEQRAESLVLGGGGNFPLGDEVGEELVDFGRSHVPGMASDDDARFQFRVVEVDVFFDPPHVGIAGSRGVVFEMDGVAIEIKEFFSLRRG